MADDRGLGCGGFFGNDCIWIIIIIVIIVCCCGGFGFGGFGGYGCKE